MKTVIDGGALVGGRYGLLMVAALGEKKPIAASIWAARSEVRVVFWPLCFRTTPFVLSGARRWSPALRFGQAFWLAGRSAGDVGGSGIWFRGLRRNLVRRGESRCGWRGEGRRWRFDPGAAGDGAATRRATSVDGEFRGEARREGGRGRRGRRRMTRHSPWLG